MRQIDFALRKIGKRTHNKFAMQAGLHGYKMPMFNDGTPGDETISPEKEKKLDAHVSSRMAEIKARKQRG